MVKADVIDLEQKGPAEKTLFGEFITLQCKTVVVKVDLQRQITSLQVALTIADGSHDGQNDVVIRFVIFKLGRVVSGGL